MTDRKTLKLRDESDQDDAAATLNKKGRGWKISEKRLDALHDRARKMRRHPSEAHKALAARFAKEDFGKFKFQKQVVIGSAIMDFASHPLGLAIDIEEADDTELAKRRDKSLAAVGIEVLRLPAQDILDDMEAVMKTVFAAMNARYREKQENRRSRPSTHQRRTDSRGTDVRGTGPREGRERR
ncbi:endonuclease domain-containing protein [Erythrobacter litoralis]|uniref:DUF559 domain-containing protein n=1 Tax=Erythrobacter litoralis (strain HTCC2594) TaxID=314225 RepID=Q2N6P4_ERYLH|nr:DUF559 domain-containing protein [Erythrobacter litoralis]ABC64647.1 hypothetical protein ELI_12775 [Erythrobacter litoralis HTCC2594]